ncbi:MAG: enolase C-terminal domain-like protein, partial [Candidatus Latescibacteria bacterium]|nr:enolase C-terminal domain-like protein [Candidatus Latescibacterota bacterium]
VQTVLRDALMGEDPADVEELWARMYRRTLPFGRKGLAIMALSGVDLALWDLRGKAAGKPAADLLGDAVGQTVPTYLGVNSADGVAERAEGYRGVKIHLSGLDPETSFDRIVTLVRDVRGSLGPEKELMMDAAMRWDLPFALKVARQVADCDLVWLEEPLPADDFEGYALLNRESPIPIAGGEHEFTAAGFEELMTRGLHAIYQPDVCWCGGLTELVKIYGLAQQYGFRVCPHRGSEVWALHAIASIDPDPLAETGRPWMTWVEGQPPIENGVIRLGDAPGFGVRFDERLWD